MNKRELKRMRRSFKKGRDALLEYAGIVKPESETRTKELLEVMTETIEGLEKLGKQEFTFVLASIGYMACALSIGGAERVMQSMEEEKKK